MGVCPFFKEGQVFVTDISKPDGFCDEAWKTISHYAFALSHGHTEPFFGGSWIENPEVAITCCNDGIRPVVFKMETANEKINNCLCKQTITGDSIECYRTRHYHSKLNTSHPIAVSDSSKSEKICCFFC